MLCFIVIYFYFIFDDNHGRYHKIPNKRPVATGWLQTICVIMFFMCRRKVSNFNVFLNFF